MIYDTFSGLLIDNRNGIAARLEGMNEKELREEVLNAYDFAACQAMEQHAECQIFNRCIKEKYGEEAYKEIDHDGRRYWIMIPEAVREYMTGVRNGKKVGYSVAAEEV